MGILLVCILANISIAVCFKFFHRKEVNSFVAIVFNYIICGILGSIILGHVPLLSHSISTRWVPFGLALGLVFIFGFQIVALSVKYTGITVTTVMQKMSLVVSAAFAIVFFAEAAGPLKLTGIGLSVAAVLLINAGHRNKREALTFDPNLIYPVLCLIVSAVIESILYYIHATGLSIDHDADLTTYAFSVAAVGGTIVLIYLYGSGRVRFQIRDYVWGLVLGIPNFFSIYLILVLLKEGFEGSALFPVLNVAVLCGSAIIGLFVFLERLNRRNYIGIALALIAIIMITLL